MYSYSLRPAVPLLLISALVLISSCTNPLRSTIEDVVAAHDMVTGEGVIYVSSVSGDDDNPGLPDKPKKTILAAIELMKDNDLTGEVRVAEGTYLLAEDEKIVIPEGVSIMGGYQDKTWVRDYETYRTVIEKDPVTSAITVDIEEGVTRATVLDGLVINSGIGMTTIAMVIKDASPTIRNCEIDGYGAIEDSTAVWVEGGSPLLEYNIIYGGAGPDTSTCIVVTNGASPVIRYNAMVPGVRSATLGIGINVIYSSPYIEGNVVMSDDGGSATVGIQNKGGSAEIYGNIIDGGSGSTYSIGILNNDDAQPRIVSNVIHGGFSDAMSRGMENSGGAAPLIRNNTISGGTCDIGSICIANFSGGSTIENNLLFSQASAGITSRYGVYQDDTLSVPVSARNNGFFNLHFTYVYPDGVDVYLGSTGIAGMESYLSGEGVPTGSNIMTDDYLIDIGNYIGNGWDLSVSAPGVLTGGGLYPADENYPWDRLGRSRTVSWSIGAYERD